MGTDGRYVTDDMRCAQTGRLPPKIHDELIKQYLMINSPAISTVHAVLDRHGLVKRRKRRRHKAQGTLLIATREPNGLWCATTRVSSSSATSTTATR